MSLASAILEIADQMEIDAKKLDDGCGVDSEDRESFHVIVLGVIRQLRSAVKAAEGQSVTIPFHMSKEEQAKIWMQKAGERKIRQKVEQEEFDQQSVVMVKLVGGTFDGDNVPCPSSTPIGHTINMDGQKYVLQNDGKYHWESEK